MLDGFESFKNKIHRATTSLQVIRLFPATMSSSIQNLIPPPTQVDDSHKNYAFGVACAIMGALGTLAVIGRLAIRYRFENLGADDYAIIPAAILFLGWATMGSWLCLNVGVGKPLWEITVDQYSMWLNGQVACIWIYPAMSSSIRIAVLLFYKRIFGIGDKTTNRLIWGLLALQIAFFIAFTVAPAGLCTDFKISFFKWAAQCDYQYFKALQTSLYTISLALDVILFLFPIYPMGKLQMKSRQRTKAVAIFAVGAAATVVASYKLAVSVVEWVHIIPEDSPFRKYQMSLYVPGQYSNYGTTFWIPSMLEPTIAILATSAPAFRQLQRRLTGKSQTERSYGSGRTGSNVFKKSGTSRGGLLKSQTTAARGQFINLGSAEIELENQSISKGNASWEDE